MSLDTEETLFAFMDQYYNELFRYGVKFTADIEGTKDNINQFFIHIWVNRDKLENVQDLKAYIFVSYKRWLITYLQHKQKYPHISLDDQSGFELSEKSFEDFLVQQIKDKELSRAFLEAIALLPKRQKELLKLRFYDHLSFEEIASLTSLSIRTVYNKLHEAINKLRNNSSLIHLRKKGY